MIQNISEGTPAEDDVVTLDNTMYRTEDLLCGQCHRGHIHIRKKEIFDDVEEDVLYVALTTRTKRIDFDQANLL